MLLKPANWALSALRLPPANALWQAAVRFLEAGPEPGAVYGTLWTNGLPTLYCWASKFPKKNSLSLKIGPPTLAPYCSSARGGIGWPTSLLKKLLASHELVRP